MPRLGKSFFSREEFQRVSREEGSKGVEVEMKKMMR